jgi:hypothetical protein
MAANSEVALSAGSLGVLANLRHGTAMFSTSRLSAIGIEALQAQIRPAADVQTVATVSILGPKMLQITAKGGAVEISYRDESKTIPEGKSIRVVLDPDEEMQGPMGSGTSAHQQPPPNMKQNRKFIFFVLLPVATGFTIYESTKALESPDRP